MNPVTQEWLQKLHPANPYQDFDYTASPLDLQAWGNSTNPIFQQLIDQIKPRLILEVGSWKGTSAIHMAQLLKQRQMDSCIICIDTWLGGLEHILKLENDQTLELHKHWHHGYPSLYFQFLANVMHNQCQDYIVPFPNTSSIAARWLLYHNIQADLIYIDASHDEEDVYLDLVNYWDLLRPQGILLGDDWRAEWHGVIAAVVRFAKEHDSKLTLETAGDKWVIQKVADPVHLQLAHMAQKLAVYEQAFSEFSELFQPS